MAEATCHYCTRPAMDECQTCGRLYCGEHGDDVCLRCLSPEAATPNAALFKGAVVALAAGTVLTAFLVVRPPESRSAQDTVRTLATPTPSFLSTATPTPPGATRVATATPPGSGTPTQAPSGSVTPAGESSYVIQPGDTLGGIAQAKGVTVADILAANPGITDNIQIGQEIKIPPPR
jgi:LysM repeat protein